LREECLSTKKTAINTRGKWKNSNARKAGSNFERFGGEKERKSATGKGWTKIGKNSLFRKKKKLGDSGAVKRNGRCLKGANEISGEGHGPSALVKHSAERQNQGGEFLTKYERKKKTREEISLQHSSKTNAVHGKKKKESAQCARTGLRPTLEEKGSASDFEGNGARHGCTIKKSGQEIQNRGMFSASTVLNKGNSFKRNKPIQGKKGVGECKAGLCENSWQQFREIVVSKTAEVLRTICNAEKGRDVPSAS